MTQLNSRCKLCGDGDETINYIKSECRKLSQKEYKTRHDWVGKVIHWESWKILKFDHPNNQDSVQENDSHKFLWNIELQTDHLITARRPDLIIINKSKRTCRIVNFPDPAHHILKLKECKERNNAWTFLGN